MDKEIICIVCPLGCRMKVQMEGQNVQKIEGNKCKKGVVHAKEEVFNPVRVLTTTVKTGRAEEPLTPVRSDKGIPRKRLIDCMTEISRCRISGPVQAGEVVISNILGLGVNIVACSETGSSK